MKKFIRTALAMEENESIVKNLLGGFACFLGFLAINWLFGLINLIIK